MKTPITLLLIALLLNACSKVESVPSSTLDAVSPADTVPNLVVIVYDLSISVDSYCYIDTGHIGLLYNRLASDGGVVYAVTILANSSMQQPLQSTELNPCRLKVVKGSAIQRDNIRAINNTLIQEHSTQRTPFVQSLVDLTTWKKEQPFSDVYGAMQIAMQICGNRKYSNYDISVILVSDCLNDIPPRNGIDPFPAMMLPDNVHLAIVRPATQIDVNSLFKGEVEVFATIHDAIESI